MDEKLKLIRDIEDEGGFIKFPVNKKSTESELLEVLHHLSITINALYEHTLPKITSMVERSAQ